MSRRGNNPSRAARTQRRARQRAERGRAVMQVPDSVLQLADQTEETAGG